MFRYLVVIVLSLPLLFTSSCCKKKLYCKAGNIDVAFTGFTRTEARSIVLKRYEIGSGFKKAIDSSRLVYAGNAPVKLNKPDTLWFSEYTISTGLLHQITWGNDWLIQMPANGKWMPVESVFTEGHASEMVKCGDDKTICTDKISAFQAAGRWFNGEKGYIQK